MEEKRYYITMCEGPRKETNSIERAIIDSLKSIDHAIISEEGISTLYGLIERAAHDIRLRLNNPRLNKARLDIDTTLSYISIGGSRIDFILINETDPMGWSVK